MSIYNYKTSEKKDLIKKLNHICTEYTEHYPKRKIYIVEQLGKRLSYLTGSGEELYLKPVEIKITDNFIVFIESKSIISTEEKETVRSRFSSILDKKANPERKMN